jgi:hypothetical protein
MRKKGHLDLCEGKKTGIRNPFWIAGHLRIARNHAGFTGVTEPEPFRLWDAWRYAYPEVRPAAQTLLVE